MINIFLLLFVVSNTNIKALGNSGIEISFSMDQVRRKEISFADASWLNGVGDPDLPSFIYTIGIPQNGDVEVQIVSNKEDILKNMTIEPVKYPVIYEEPITEVLETHSDVYKKNKFFPENLVEISEPGYFRDIYVVDVRLNPVQYNPITKELKVSRDLKIRINFKGKAKTKQVLDTSFEEIYKRTIINYEQCKTWRREPKMNDYNPFSLGTWFKVIVDEEGIYRIGYEEVRDAGLDPGQFDPKTMKIFTAAFDTLARNVVSFTHDSLIEIPVYVHGEDDHSFDKDDYLVFYGYPANHFLPDSEIGWFENGYALDNVYWFTFGAEDGKRMERVNAAWDGGTADTLVNEILHIEENIGKPFQRSGINWYWFDISPGDASLGSGSIMINHPRAAGSAGLKVGIYTFDSATFLYQLELDGDVFYSETLFVASHYYYPPYYHIGETNVFGDSSELTISIIRPSGTATELTALLNNVDMQYERITDMNLPFHAFYSTGQEYSLKCSNINAEPFVFDITNLNKPMMFDNLSIQDNQMFLSGSSDSFQLLYFSNISLAKSAELIDAMPGRLRTQLSGCEYLFVTHKNFYNAIQPLVDYRRNEYTTKVVTIDDIYDDFSFGKYDPLAIKYFLYFTTNNWTNVPKYVLLVGDGTFDYKNNEGKASPPNFIPMYESGTKISGNAGIPSNFIYEGEYVNFNGYEAMVLGRITVRTNQEVRDFIDKVFTYETSNIDGIWNKRLILAGDDEYSNTAGPESTTHCSSCESLIPFVPDSLYDFAKVYMISYLPFYPSIGDKPRAQKDFIKEINKGGLAGVFFGHGNTHQLADEGLFFDTNIPQINNGRRYMFFYFGSCTVGRFDDSDYECIGEQFVRIPDGTIGTMASTQGTGCGENTTIGQRLFNSITDLDTNLTMGECHLIAKNGYWNTHYLLLGDPATKLRKVNILMNISASPDSLRPLEQLKIMTDENHYYLKAFIRDTTTISKIDETTADKFSGYVFRLVAPNDVPFGYEIDGKEIYNGFWDEDTAEIIVPKLITTHLPIIKLSSFMSARSGMYDSIRIYGNALLSPDQTGPEIDFYDGAKKLKDGDWVTKELTLTGKVSDASGINILYSVGNDRGFYLYINKDTDNKIDLRDHFLYDRNSYTSGEFNIALELPKAKDTITVNIADNNDNITIKEIILNAEIFGQVSIENFLIYPNPIRNDDGVWFTFNLTNSGLVDLKIFTIAGRLIKTLEDVSCGAGYNQIFWNILDEHQDEISNGVYIVKAYVEAENDHDDVVEKFIIAR